MHMMTMQNFEVKSDLFYAERKCASIVRHSQIQNVIKQQR